MSYGRDFVLTLFTNDPALAQRADAAGINRIGLDLEKIGKHTRQDPKKCWISDHRVEQLADIRSVLTGSKLFARTNPIQEGSGDEIEQLIALGTQVLMLPLFRTVDEAARFIDLIDGRAEVSLLVETSGAAMRIHDLVRLDGVDEIHVGLNDMYLDMGLRNHFEVLVSGLLDVLSDTVRGAGIAFGVGGIGRVGDKSLPIAPEMIYPFYPLLHADRALVSRVFYAPDHTRYDLTAEVAAFRHEMDRWAAKSKEELVAARDALRAMVRT